MTSTWTDLRTRVISALVMAIVGVGCLWAGGIWFALLIMVCCGVMNWELSSMIGGSKSISLILGVLGGLAPVALLFTGEGTGAFQSLLPFLMVSPAIAGIVLLAGHRQLFALYSTMIIAACASMLVLRQIGLEQISLIILIVVLTDVAGYFAGRLIGGPKFWPKISPKKTWAGTTAGWIAAGAAMGLYYGGIATVALGVLLSFASQMGDIAESALKRRMGVKDSSNLIPGHGGLLDRFDGMVGGSLAMMVLTVFGLNF